MPHCFQSQIDVAAFDIGLDIFPEARPIVFPADELFCFIDIEITY